MWSMYEDLEELCNIAGKKLHEVNEKVRGANGKITQGDVEYMDTLAHMIKSIKTTMAMMDAEGGNSYRGSYDGRSYDGSYEGRSYDRGMSRDRDSMGRYSGRMYRDTGTINKLREMMRQADDDQTREEFQKFIEKMEHM